MSKAKPKKKSPSKKKSSPSKKTKKGEKSKRPRGLSKGSISVGLVHIPVYLESAKPDERLQSRLIDKRDQSAVGYKQINTVTGKEIARNVIVSGYAFKTNEFVLMSDAD